MSQYKSQVQNQFLSQARKKHMKVEVILETGSVLRGKLKAYDQFSISLAFKDKVEIVYKSSIIYICALPMLRPPMGGDRRPYNRTSAPEPRSGGYRRPDSDAPVPEKKPFPDFDEDFEDPPPPKKLPAKRF
ncbi:MAG: RNA chaperone Hfq [Candidatus Riflebacteria bacterium]|nr:RNA chaperone Hfq [Candidatus Riflebacteria bacterium]